MTTDRSTVILYFENRHYNPISIIWIDSFETEIEKSLKPQTELDPGESYMQGSFVGDEWIAQDQVTQDLLLKFTARKDDKIIVNGTRRRMPTKGSTLDIISAAHRPIEPEQNFALDFDGENDVVVIPHQDDLHLGEEDGYQWTLEAWVFRVTDRVEHPILEKSDGENGGYALRIGENGRLQAGILQGTNFVFGEGTTYLNPRQWYHLAATFDGRTRFKYTDRYELLWTNPSDQYDRNVAFYRPIAPNGYVLLGDLCEPGLIDPAMKTGEEMNAAITRQLYQLPRRILVARPEAGKFQAATGFDEVWRDDTIGLSLHRPTGDAGFHAMGLVVHTGAGSPTSEYFLAHEDLLDETAVEAFAEWANTPANDRVLTNPLRVWSLLGTGFFVADQPAVNQMDTAFIPTTGLSIFSVKSTEIETAYSQFQLYVNGQAEVTTIKRSRDIQSNRTVLDLNGEDEFLVLPLMEAQDYTAGLTLESWVYFRHPEPIWDVVRGTDDAVKFPGTYPILHLRELTAERKALRLAEAALEVATQNSANAEAAFGDAFNNAKANPAGETPFRTAIDLVEILESDMTPLTIPVSTDTAQITQAEEDLDNAKSAIGASKTKLREVRDTFTNLASTAVLKEDGSLEDDLDSIIGFDKIPPALQEVIQTTAYLGVYTDTIAGETLSAASQSLTDAITDHTNAADDQKAAAQLVVDAASTAKDKAQAVKNQTTLIKEQSDPAFANPAPADIDAFIEILNAIDSVLPAFEPEGSDSPLEPTIEVQTALNLLTSGVAAARAIMPISTKLSTFKNTLTIESGTVQSAITAVKDLTTRINEAPDNLALAAETAEKNTRRGLFLSYSAATNRLIFQTERGTDNTPSEIEIPDFLQIETRETNPVYTAARTVAAVHQAVQDNLLSATIIDQTSIADEKIKVVQAAVRQIEETPLADRSALTLSLSDIQGDALEAYDKILAALNDVATLLKSEAEAASTKPLPNAGDAAQIISDKEAARDKVGQLVAAAELLLTQLPEILAETNTSGQALKQQTSTVLAAAKTAGSDPYAAAETARLIHLARVVEIAAEALIPTFKAKEDLTGAADLAALADLNEIVFASAVELNTWIHLALSLDNTGQLTIYKNGQALPTLQQPAAVAGTAILLSNTIDWETNRLGASIANLPDFFNGSLAEFRIWNSVQTAEKIETLFDREIGNFPNLVAYYPLHEGPQANRILDYSGSGFHIQQLREVPTLHAASSLGHYTADLHDDLKLTYEEFRNDNTNAEGVGELIPSKTRGHLSLELWFRLDSTLTNGDRVELLRHGNYWVLELIQSAKGTRIVFSYKKDRKGNEANAIPWVVAAQDIDQIIPLTGKGWTHLLLVYNAEDMNDPDDEAFLLARVTGFYLDGEFIKLDTALPADPPEQPVETLVIGTGTRATDDLRLFLAEVYCWRTLLPPFVSLQDRFYQLRAAELSDPNLIAYWPFNGPVDSTETFISSAGSISLTWEAASANPASVPPFVTNDLRLNPANLAPHKWNSRSVLRLLPFSIVPRLSQAPLKIGALEPQNSLMRLGLLRNTHFEGMIDSVRIWKTARAATDIKAFWNQKIDGEDEDLLRYYRFDTGSGNFARNYFTREGAINLALDGKFGGNNEIRNLRLWTVALDADQLRLHMETDAENVDTPADFPFSGFLITKDAAGNITQTTAQTTDEGLRYLSLDDHATQNAAGDTIFPAPGRDERVLAKGEISFDDIDLDGDFTIELEVRIDTFVLSGREHYLVFKQDAWALELFRDKGELYFAFTYDYKNNIQRRAWKRIVADHVPITKRKWAYVAVVGEDVPGGDAADEIRMYVDQINRSQRTLSEAVVQDLFEPKTTSFPLQLGEEGKPKWALSDLLLMDGLIFDGSQTLVKLPRMAADFQKGLTLEAWIFVEIHPTNDSWHPIIDLGKGAPGDDIILAVQQSASGVLHLAMRIYDETTPATLLADGPLAAGEWIHVAGTIAPGGNGILYANGDEIANGALNVPRNVAREEGFCFIGKSNPDSLSNSVAGDFFRGKIDEVRIWSRPRRAEQLKGYLRRELPEVHEHLIGMWRFGEGSGVAAFDSTSNGYHGLLGDGQDDDTLPEWVITSERLNAGLRFAGHGFVRIQAPEEVEDPFHFGPADKLTLEAWIRPEAQNQPASQIILISDLAETAGIRFRCGAAPGPGESKFDLVVELFTTATQQTYTFDDAFTPGRWTHVAACFEFLAAETKVKLIVHEEDEFDPAAEPAAGATQNLNIIFDESLRTTFHKIDLGKDFTGSMDELRLWPDARTDQEVNANLFAKVDPFDSNTPVVAIISETETILLEDNHSFINKIQQNQSDPLQEVVGLSIPAGRSVSVIWRRREGITDGAETITSTFETSTADIYAAQDFVRANYQLEQIQLGFSDISAMLGYWPMNENTGRIIQDKTSLRNEGVFFPQDQEPPSWIETSDIQFGGYRFDGFSEFIEIPGDERINPTTDFSISAWVEPNRFHGLQGIVTKVTDIENSQLALSMEGEMLRFDYERDGNNFSLVGGKIKDGWNHVAVTVKTRLIDSEELLADKNYLLSKPKAFLEFGRPTAATKIFLDSNIKVDAGNPLRGLKSVELPATRALLITWGLKNRSDQSLKNPYRPQIVAKEYRESTDNIFTAFLSNPTRTYEVRREDIENEALYEIVSLRSPLITSPRQLKLPKIHLYVNGLLVHSGIAPRETIASSFDLNIGAWGGKVRDYFFHGTIDNVALWKRALSQKEIQATKDQLLTEGNEDLLAEFPGVFSALAAYWRPNPLGIQAGVPNVLPSGRGAFGLGQLGVYDKSGIKYLYGQRKARRFTSGDTIDFPNINLSGAAFTLEYWFRPSPSQMGRVFTLENAAGDRFIRSGMGIPNPEDTTKTLLSHSFSNDPDATAPSPFYDIYLDSQWNVLNGDWHHVALVWEQNKSKGYRTYLDGELIAMRDTVNVPIPKIDGTIKLGNTAASNGFAGDLAEVRIWSTARLESDIRRDKDRKLKGDELGLVAYWQLDEADGADGQKAVMRDEALKNDSNYQALLGSIFVETPPYNGQPNDTVHIAQSGLYLLQELRGVSLNAISFDGEDDYIFIEDVPGIQLNANFSVEAWIQLPCQGPIFSRMALDPTLLFDARPAWKCLYVNNNNELIFAIKPAIGRYQEMGRVPIPILDPEAEEDEGWRHIAVTVDARRLRMLFYVNGRLVQRVNLRSSFRREDPRILGRENPITNINVGVGRVSDGVTIPLDYFSGSIGELRFWNNARSGVEIENNFDQALKRNEIGLEGLWRFIQGEGEVIDNLLPEESSAGMVYGASWAFNTGFTLNGLGDDESANLAVNTGSSDPNCLFLAGGSSKLDLGPVFNLSSSGKLDTQFVNRSNGNQSASADHSLTENLSIELWFYLNDLTGTHSLISKGADGEFEINVMGGKLNYFHGGTYRHLYDTVLLAQQWYHLAIVRENGIKLIRTYINGELQTPRVFDITNFQSVETSSGTERASDAPKLYAQNASPLISNHRLTVGNDPAASRGLRGRILDVRIWNYPLTGNRIKLMRGRRLRGDEFGLICYLPLSSNQNALDAQEEKTVEVTSVVNRTLSASELQQISFTLQAIEVKAGNQNAISVPIPADQITFNEMAFLPNDRHHVLTYTLTISGPDPEANYVQVQIVEQMPPAVRAKFISVKNSNAGFILQRDFRLATPVAGNPLVVSPLLALPDLTMQANHGVLALAGSDLNNARVAPIGFENNQLAAGESGSLRIKVRVISSQALDSYPNTVSVSGRGSNPSRRDRTVLEVAGSNTDALTSITQSPLGIANPFFSVTVHDPEIDPLDDKQSTYTITIDNISADEAFSEIQLIDALEDVFDFPDIIKWEVLSVENATSPASLIPFLLNPMFNGREQARVLGLDLEAPRDVFAPPINLRKVERDRRIRQTQSGRNRQAGSNKYARPEFNNPAQTNFGTPAPPTPVTSGLRAPVVSPVATEVAVADRPAAGIRNTPLELKMNGAGLELVDAEGGNTFVLPAEASQVLRWASTDDTESPLFISLSGPGEGISLLPEGSPTDVNGIQIVGTVNILDKAFRLSLKLLKNATGWDYTFIFSLQEDFDFSEIGLGKRIPVLNNLELKVHLLSSEEEGHLTSLEGDGVGSLAAVEGFIQSVAAKLDGLAAAEVNTAIEAYLEADKERAKKEKQRKNPEQAEPDNTASDALKALLEEVIAEVEAGQAARAEADFFADVKLEVDNLKDPYPGLHTHQRSPMRMVHAIFGGLQKRRQRGAVSAKVEGSAYVQILAYLLQEKEARQADLAELKTRALMPLGFAISSMGEENTKIGPGFSLNGAIALDAAGDLLVVEPSEPDLVLGFFLNYDPQSPAPGADRNSTPAEDAFLAELRMNVALEGSNNPAFFLANEVFGLTDIDIFGYMVKQGGDAPQDIVGMRAMTEVDLTNPSSELTSLIKSIFGLEKISLMMEGSKSAGQSSPDLMIEAHAFINVAESNNPLLRIAHELIGLNAVELVMAADSTGSSKGVSMVATGYINLREADTALMDFILDLFGIEDAQIVVTMEVTRSGGTASLGVSAEIEISIGDSSSPFFEFVHKFFGIETISVLIEVDENEFGLRIDLGIDKPIAEVHRLVQVFIAMYLEYKPPATDIQLGMVFRLDTGSGIILLLGALGVQTGPGGAVVEGTLGMQGAWVNPLGIEGLAIYTLIIQLGLQPELPWIARIAMAAELQIGKPKMEIAVKVDLDNPSNSGFVGEINNINMAEVVNGLTGPKNTIPASIQSILAGMQLNRFRLSVIPNPPLDIGVPPVIKTYNDEGVTALCDLNLWGFEAFAFLQINYTDGITAFASFSEFELVPGVLKIARSDAPLPDGISNLSGDFVTKGGPEMFIKLNAYDTPSIYINGKITLLDMMSKSLLLYIDANQIIFDMETNFLDLFVISLHAEVATDFSSIFIRAEMRNDFFAKVREIAVRRIQDLRDAALGELNKAQDEVDKIWDAIEDRRRVVRAELDKATKKIREAEADIRSARNKVNGIRKKIKKLDNDFEDLPKFSLTKKSRTSEAIPYGIKKAALEAAVAIANGILWAAEKFLEGLRKVIEIIPVDLDPVIIGLKITWGIATAGLEIAKLAVKGFAEIATGLAKLALGGFFDVRYAMFQGIYSTGLDGQFEVEMRAKIIFLGQEVDIDFRLDLKAIENGVQGLVTKLLEG